MLLPADAEGTYLVVGEGDLHGLDLLPLHLITKEQRSVLGAAVANAAGGANVIAQSVNAANQVRGLVRLAPETIKTLSAGAQPIAKGGWNLGTLTVGGRFSHSVRWLPAGSASAANILASAGSAATLLAIQWQLAQISRLVERNIALTQEVLERTRIEQWAGLKGHHDTIAAALGHAEALGRVTPDIWQHTHTQSSEATLRAHRQMFFEYARTHLQSLERQSGARARRDWLAQNAEAVLRDVQALLVAERAWFAYQALRAAHLSQQAETNEDDRLLQRRIVDDARAAFQNSESATLPLIDQIYRHFRLMEECPGGVGLTINGRNHTPQQVAAAARILGDQIECMVGAATIAPNTVLPACGWYGIGDSLGAVIKRLQWILTKDEHLIAVAYVAGGGPWFLASGYLVFTHRRILFLKSGPFLKEGRVDRDIHWRDVRDVWRPKKPGPMGGPRLFLVIDEQYEFFFNSDVTNEHAAALVDAVQQAMKTGRAAERRLETH
jgi:hypothetical protein